MRCFKFAVCTFFVVALCVQSAFSSDVDDRLKAIEENAEKALQEDITPAAWQDLMKSAKDAYKAGRYQESLKLFNRAEIVGRNRYAEQKGFSQYRKRIRSKTSGLDRNFEEVICSAARKNG